MGIQCSYHETRKVSFTWFIHPDESKPVNKRQGSNAAGAAQIVRFTYDRHRLLLSEQVASVFGIEKKVKAMLL
jgi:hypothetical protein